MEDAHAEAQHAAIQPELWRARTLKPGMRRFRSSRSV